MAKKISEIVAENMKKQQEVQVIVDAMRERDEKDAAQIAINKARTEAVLNGTSDKLVKETETVAVQETTLPLNFDPIPMIAGVCGFILGCLVMFVFFKIKIIKVGTTIIEQNKKPPISYVSIMSLIVSISAFGMYSCMLNGGGSLGFWMYVVWYIASAAALFFPVGAKRIRQSEGKRGKFFEVVALIIGVIVFMGSFSLVCSLFFPNSPYFLTWLVDISILVIVVYTCVLYSKVK